MNSIDFNTTHKNIMDLCYVERAVAGKIYPFGSCYVKLSAVDDFVGQLKQDGQLESRYAVFEPKTDFNKDYFFIAVSRSFPDFLRKYRTTINLQFSSLQHFEVEWHDSKEAQKYIVENMKVVDNAIAEITAQISDEKEMKRYFLNGMMET